MQQLSKEIRNNKEFEDFVPSQVKWYPTNNAYTFKEIPRKFMKNNKGLKELH